MNKKVYTIAVQHETGAILSIGVYADAMPGPFRIYYEGRDTGRRFEKVGNAARYLEKVFHEWGPKAKKITAGKVDDLPKKGTPHNIKLFNYWYNGGNFPTWEN